MIVVLSISISVVGLALFAVLGLRIREAESAIRLKRHRSRAAGVADLLNYACMVDDGIIACKSGALMAAWIYAGEDNASRTDAERERSATAFSSICAPIRMLQNRGWENMAKAGSV